MRTTIWTGGGLLLLAGLLLFGFGASNPNALRWAALSAFALYAFAIWAWNGAAIPRDPLSWAAIAFVAYAGASIDWSPDQREGLVQIISVASLLALFLAIRHSPRWALSMAVPVAAVGAYWTQLWITIYRPGIYGGLGNENFQAEFLVLLVPFVLVWARQFPKTPFGALCLITAVCALGQAIAFNGSNAQFAGLAILGVGFTGFVLAGRQYGLAGGLALFGAAGAWAAWTPQILKSLLARYEMAYNTAFMWLDAPWFGVGLGGFNYEYPRYGELHLEWAQTPECLANNTCTSAHGVQHFVGAAHNEYLQALAQFGIVGFVLAGMVVYLAIRRRNHKTTQLEWCGLAALAILAGLSFVGFPMQNPPTATLGIAALGMASGRQVHGYVTGWHKWPVRLCIPFVAVFLIGFHFAAYKGAWHFTQATRWAKMQNPVQSLRAANHAFKAFPWRAQYRMQMALSLEAARANDKRVRVKPSVADRANRISRSAAPYHHGVLFARGAYLVNTGRWRTEQDEMAQIVADLERYGSSHPESWMVIAAYRGGNGDKQGAISAVDKAIAQGGRFEDVQATAAGFGLRISKHGE